MHFPVLFHSGASLLAVISKPVLFCYFVFLMAYYYFVLRKYNTLGFRMFSLFFFTSCAVCYWWHVSDRDLKSIQKTGVATNALVVKKTPDILRVRFTDQTGKEVERTQEGGVSVQELAAVNEGQSAPILYTPNSQTIYLATSFQRQLQDNIVILYFGVVLFLIGCGCWVFLRNLRVHAHGDGSINEYVTNEKGEVVLDDARSPLTRFLRNFTTWGKLFSLFRR